MSYSCEHDGKPCVEKTCGGHWQCGCPLDRAMTGRAISYQLDRHTLMWRRTKPIGR